MKTLTIQIGNSDDKLTQAKWCQYVDAVERELRAHNCKIHFAGGSSNWLPWQNFAWVIELDPPVAPSLKDSLLNVREDYGQDAVAWTEGETHFV